MTEFRQATKKDSPRIWEILQEAIAQRKAEGSDQWQDGYPNPTVIAKDLKKKGGYVLEYHNRIIGYVCISINDEPAYNHLKGKWLSNADYMVYHRIAIAKEVQGKGYAVALLKEIEQIAIEKGIASLKADTNFDNYSMLGLFKKLNYQYCGKVSMRGSERLAYEKILEL